MGTSDVLKVLKIARAVGECNLRTFKTSRVTINHGMYEQVHTIFYLLFTQTRYFVRVTHYLKRFNGFQYAHMFYLNQSEIYCCDRQVKFLKDFEKKLENISENI